MRTLYFCSAISAALWSLVGFRHRLQTQHAVIPEAKVVIVSFIPKIFLLLICEQRVRMREQSARERSTIDVRRSCF